MTKFAVEVMGVSDQGTGEVIARVAMMMPSGITFAGTASCWPRRMSPYPYEVAEWLSEELHGVLLNGSMTPHARFDALDVLKSAILSAATKAVS